MIAEKAAGKSFRNLVHELVIEPYGLTSTFYEASSYPGIRSSSVCRTAISRTQLAPLINLNAEEIWNAPILGRDVRTFSVSWMQSRWRRGLQRPRCRSLDASGSLAGRWFRRSSNKNGLSLSRLKQASRSRRCPPMTRPGSPSGLALQYISGPFERPMVLRG